MSKCQAPRAGPEDVVLRTVGAFMTVPRERFRALRWARQWLKDVACDPMVPAEVQAEAAALLASYPADAAMRALISRQATGLPLDVAESLCAASKWIFAFGHPTTDPRALQFVRRHMPTCGEIATKVQSQKRDDALLNKHFEVQSWLEPDEDCFLAFVAGWFEDCAVAVGAEWANADDDELMESANPVYLINARTSGVRYAELHLGQRVLCTVTRPWNEGRRWRHVKSCDPVRDQQG